MREGGGEGEVLLVVRCTAGGTSGGGVLGGDGEDAVDAVCTSGGAGSGGTCSLTVTAGDGGITSLSSEK